MSETEPQLDAQVLHRVRNSLISQQTSQNRGILLERCIVVPHDQHSLLDILVALFGAGPYADRGSVPTAATNRAGPAAQ